MTNAPPAPAPPIRHVPCPRCGRAALFGPQNRFRPFCGPRCREADLGAWASEDYRLPADSSPADEDSDAPPTGRGAPPSGRH